MNREVLKGEQYSVQTSSANIVMEGLFAAGVCRSVVTGQAEEVKRGSS